MLSINKIKYIRSLSLKKFRDKNNVFIAEGEKLIGELLPFFTLQIVIVDLDICQLTLPKTNFEYIEAPLSEIKKISNLSTARPAIAVFEKKSVHLNNKEINNSLSLVLDGIQDPGNLGTILRVADWFGIKNVVCSEDTVDAYNPKVVQATMGAMARVNVHYQKISDFFKQITVPIYGTFLEGQSIYKSQLSNTGVIVMGNEGNGIRPELISSITHKLLIPPYPADSSQVESLNVGVATSIICAEFRRRTVLSLSV